MDWTTDDITGAARRCAEMMQAAEHELNTADGRLGDGDTGQTMRRLAETIADAAEKPAAGAPDVGAFLRKLGIAGTTATGSSLGTLVSIGLMEMGRHLSAKPVISLADLAAGLEVAEATMLARGGATLGDKTALDLLHAVRTVLASEPSDPSRSAIAAAKETLDAFRGKPCRIGRARMFSDRSAGVDDPGMLAFAKLTVALTGGRQTLHSAE